MMQHVLGPGAGYVGTLGMMAGDVSRPNQLTTPASDVLHDFLAHLPDQCPGVALEASSIGLHQARLAGLTFRAAVLTNVGSDHLDYHGSQAAYERAKRSLFASLAPDGIAVLPGDDPVCEGVMAEIQERTPGVRIFTVGRWQGTALLQPKDTGAWHLSVGDASAEFHLAMPGEYNRRNATQALLAIAGDGWQSRITALQDLPVIRGRLEEVAPRVFVDYAHTPQALHAVLSAVRAAYPESRLIAVAGCGGDRDVAKRPAMGAALRLADIAVITTDNPRSESPVQIAADMVRDLDPELIAWNGEEKPIRVVHDRGQAIRLALQLAGSDAVVVVCGKGHETQQLLATGPIAWDDAEVIRAEVTQLAGSHDI
jgi:UDP-N-acetylmuramoyl-L-alanyl-D-glutamate--2,6-diaminopimelate ligase